MPYAPLFVYVPAIAEKETRVITLLSSANEFNLPKGEYAFVELFCDECDCRRAFFQVITQHTKGSVATISWGWETEQFYIKWYGENDKEAIKEMMGSSLAMLASQSAFAPNVLAMFNKLLLKDNNYTARVKAHYDLFRKALKKKKR